MTLSTVVTNIYGKPYEKSVSKTLDLLRQAPCPASGLFTKIHTLLNNEAGQARALERNTNLHHLKIIQKTHTHSQLPALSFSTPVHFSSVNNSAALK